MLYLYTTSKKQEEVASLCCWSCIGSQTIARQWCDIHVLRSLTDG